MTMHKFYKRNEYNLKIIIHDNGLYIIDVVSHVKLNIKLFENWILIVFKTFGDSAIEIIEFLCSKSDRLDADYKQYLKMINEI